MSSIQHEWDEEFAGIPNAYIWAEGDDAKVIAGLAGWPRAEAYKRVMLLSRDGVNLVCLKTTKHKGRELRRWLALDVLPQIQDAGRFVGEIPKEAAPPLPNAERSSPLMTGDDPVLGALQSLTTMRQQQLVEAEARKALEGRVAALEARTIQPATYRPPAGPSSAKAIQGPVPAVENLRALPPTLLRAALDKYMRERMAEEVSPRADDYGMKINARWQQLYISFRDHYQINAGKEAVRIAKERGRKIDRLDAVAVLGKMPELVALAMALWPDSTGRAVRGGA